MITFGNTSIELTFIAVFLAVLTVKLLFLIAVICFVVQGFRVHWGWGMANLLIPGAIIPFCLLHRKESKRPLILTGFSVGVILILWVCARHDGGSHSKVELSPDLPPSAKNAVLYLRLVSSSDALSTNWTRTATSISCSLSQKNPVMSGMTQRPLHRQL